MSAMSSEPKTARPMLDLSKWRKVPMLLMSGGGVLALIGAILFTKPGFYITSIACFLIWWFLTRRLRYWSLRQDKTGDALPTYKMRFLSAIGIVLFAITVTWGSVLWMKALQHEWYSTMYGVYY